MKATILILFCLIVVFGFYLRSGTDSSSLRIVIDRNTTAEGLAGIIDGAKSANIRLVVDEAAYDANGKMKKIKGEVKFPNSGNGTFSSDNVGKIIITQDLNSGNEEFSIVVQKRWF